MHGIGVRLGTWLGSSPPNLGTLSCFSILFTVGGLLNCDRIQPLVGEAKPIHPSERSAPEPDWDRLDQISRFAKRTKILDRDLRPTRWEVVGKQLLVRAETELGELNSMDRYWLGNSWWAAHQPIKHVRYPKWAPMSQRDPNLALRHPLGGNCESSANGHAALMNYLGVPSRPIYGFHLGDKEGHVWVLSDVEGRPLFSDVHVARMRTQAERDSDTPWRPSPVNVQVRANAADLSAFLSLHEPHNPLERGFLR